MGLKLEVARSLPAGVGFKPSALFEEFGASNGQCRCCKTVLTVPAHRSSQVQAASRTCLELIRYDD